MFLSKEILIIDPEEVIVLAGAVRMAPQRAILAYFTPPSIRHRPTLCKASRRLLLKPEELPEPRWPEEDFSDLLRITFKNNIIDSPDHIVSRQLAGEV